MQARPNQKSGALVPVAITAAVAALGTAALLLIVLSPDQDAENGGIGMRSAAAAYLAGATITRSSTTSAAGATSEPISPIVIVDRKG